LSIIYLKAKFPDKASPFFSVNVNKENMGQAKQTITSSNYTHYPSE